MTRVIVIISIGALIFMGIFSFQVIREYDNKLHLIFCDVGQGDAILIRTPKRHDILIDGGPDKKVLECLSQYLPFWDREISVMLLTHPHYDHFRGLIDVLSRYDVQLIGQEALKHESDAYAVFNRAMDAEGARIQQMEKGIKLSFPDGVVINILGPDDEFLAQENPDGFTGSDNPPSLIIEVTYGSFEFLHSGDSDDEDLVRFLPQASRPDIFSLAHHGSEHGYTGEVSKVLTSPIGIISAGKKNRYGHPHAAVLNLLEHTKTEVLRTDIHGSIEVMVDDKGVIKITTEQ